MKLKLSRLSQLGSILPKGEKTTQNKSNVGDNARYGTCCFNAPVNGTTAASEIASDGLGISTIGLCFPTNILPFIGLTV
jgi:hypothetical protein